MKIAIEGCCHGQLDSIYASLKQAEERAEAKVDLLLICGDFQAIRNPADLRCLAVPDKYRLLGGFHKYYSGETVAPVLTIIIGGNHEASNYMWELYHGGWVAPHIYYLGGAGSLLINGLRISGASGIYNDRSYYLGHHETMPYTDSTMRSIYHTRQYDIYRLAQLSRQKPDIFLSHDWPCNIDKYGNTAGLVKYKPYFAEEIKRNSLGSPPLMNLLQTLQPPLWFSAHLHAKFAGLVKHDNSPTQVLNRGQAHSRVSTGETQSSLSTNPDAIDLDFEDDEAPTAGGTSRPAEELSKPIVNPDEIDFAISDSEAEQEKEEVNPDAIEIEVNIGEDGEEVVLDIKDPNTVESVDKALQPDAEVDESVELAKAKAALLASLAGMPSQPSSPEKVEIQSRPPSSMEADASFPSNGYSKKNMSYEQQKLEVPVVDMDKSCTKFLALSKCGHRKQFLQLIDLPDVQCSQPVKMTCDPLWLAITRAFHPHLSLARKQDSLPNDATEISKLLDAQIEWVAANLPEGGAVPVEQIQQFTKTAPSTLDPGGDQPFNPSWYTNPQTLALMSFLQLENKINPAPKE